MKKEGYYSSGEFAKLSLVTKKTLRYYDEKNILKPSLVTESGARFYTEDDLGKMQQISLLKYLGFSLADIKEMLLSADDTKQLGSFLQIQKKLVEDKIEQLHLVEETIESTNKRLSTGKALDWSSMLEITRITGLENSMRNQYKNASNISARIQLHKIYSTNKTGWFPWIFKQLPLKPGIRVLEIGCGDGNLWKGHKIEPDISVTLTDITDGMLRDAKRNLGSNNGTFTYQICDANKLIFEKGSFDIIIANHVLFYCEDVDKTCKKISSLLKTGGCLIAGTYGKKHMKEVTDLVQDFNEEIVLSQSHLYDKFGKENGGEILSKYFKEVEWREYEDSLNVTEAEPLIAYVLSCHGNQNQYIVDNYSDFKNFVKKKTLKGYNITKEAGIFVAKK